MGAFDEFIFMLKGAGVIDVILPFALVFTIVFAILEKTKILGDKDGKPLSNMNAMIGLVMGFSVIVPHVLGYYPMHRDPVEIINTSLPSVSIILVAILMVMMMIGLFFDKAPVLGADSKGANWAVGAAIIVVAFIFLSNAGFLNLHLYITRGTQNAVVALLIFGVIIKVVMGSSKDDDGGSK